MRIRSLNIIILILACIRLSGQENYFRQYGPTDGLGNQYIYSINQGNDGFLWIGTAEGLYRFDGYEFRHYTEKDNLAEDFVTVIFKDFSGGLWLGHMNGGITHIVDSRFTKFSDTTSVYSSISSITESDTGTIWFSTQNQGLLVYDSTNRMTRISVPIDEIIVKLMYISGNLFLAGTQESLYILEYQKESSSMTVKQKISDYPSSKVAEVLKMKKGEYFVFSKDKGIYSLSASDSVFECNHVELNEAAERYIDNTQGAIKVKQNEVWVNTTFKGVIKFNIENSTGKLVVSGYINAETGLQSNEVKCMFEDDEGNIWLGMYGGGLLRLINDNLKFLTYARTLGSDQIYSLSRDSIYIWLATDNKVARISPETGQVRNFYPFPEYLSGARVNSVYCATDSLIYLGFEKEGLYALNPVQNSIVKIQLSTDVLENSVKYITGKGNTLWIGTRKGACKLNITSGKMMWFNKSNGLPNNDIQELFVDSDGRILVGTSCNTVYYINAEDTVKTLKNIPTFGLNSIMSFSEDNAGSIWIGTYGNGVFKFAENGNLNYTVASGLISDYCYSMIYDEMHRIFIGHRGGISQIDTKTDKIRSYNYNEGIKNTTDFYPNSVLSDNYNNIWFGTSDGIIILNSRTGTGSMKPLPMHIDAIYINKGRISPNTTITLKPGNYEIRIEYSGINLSNPDNVTYQTMLEGYSSSWSDLSSRRSVTYEKVGYGQYVFKLKAFNENFTPVKDPLTIRLKIKKPVYLSFWFYLIIISLAIFALYEFIRIRESAMKALQEKLLKNLDEKTKEIIVKEEIIKERQKNEQVLIAAKERAELSDRLKTSFLTNISHEIRTPMNAIVGSSELLKSQNFPEEERIELLNLIVSNSNSLIGLIDDILDISKIESNQLKINFEECMVYPLLLELHKRYTDEMQVREKAHLDFRLSFEPENHGFSFKTDEIRLKQVLGKLLDNSIKFTDSGFITLGCSTKNDKVLFYVEDTGIGMSEDKKQVIFELFRKMEEDKLRLYRGTGLGLSLSQSLVKLMGGEIAVESELNRGSKFYFTLPLVQSRII